MKATASSVASTVKNIFTPDTGNKNSYPLTAKSNFSSPGSYPAAEYASVFTNAGYTPAQNPTYTVKTIGGKSTLVPAHFDNPTAAATSFVKEHGCDPSKAKAKKQEASGWLEAVKNVGKSVYSYLSESASHWGSKALHPTGVGDFLYSGANWFTYGLVNGVVQGYKDRNDTMWQNPSTYNIINWASSGLLDTAKGTFVPENPLSAEHWMNSASFALVLYGGYTAAKNISSTAPANTISTPHPSTGTGMLDDFADDAAGRVKQTVFKNQKLFTEHFEKHSEQFKKVFNNPNYNATDYLNDANHVINNGIFVPEMNGYVKFVGGDGSAKYAFVGLDGATGDITTFHLKTVSELSKKAPSFGFQK